LVKLLHPAPADFVDDEAFVEIAFACGDAWSEDAMLMAVPRSDAAAAGAMPPV
jgi:hypothetical protein